MLSPQVCAVHHTALGAAGCHWGLGEAVPVVSREGGSGARPWWCWPGGGRSGAVGAEEPVMPVQDHGTPAQELKYLISPYSVLSLWKFESDDDDSIYTRKMGTYYKP